MIDDDLKLKDFLAQLSAAPWIALDTEADSLHAYPEKICLLQISIPAKDELIDPLSPIDLDLLWFVLRGRELIVHGSDYDLRLLRKHHNFIPTAIFDTMLASRLLGITQFGLTHLVVQYLGITLEKGSQKADWAKRPLTEKMIEYARNDTHFLKALSDILRQELIAKGRLAWQEECCARLVAECAELHPADPDLIWRIKGSNRLSPAALAVVREIWRWREAEATAGNKPPYFILRHESLIDLAQAAVTNHPLAPLIPQRFSDRRRHALTAAINEGLAVDPAQHPQPLRTPFRRVTDADKQRVEELQKRRDEKAKELGIDPTLIASRATLLNLAEDWNASQLELMNWQRELLK